MDIFWSNHLVEKFHYLPKTCLAASFVKVDSFKSNFDLGVLVTISLFKFNLADNFNSESFYFRYFFKTIDRGYATSYSPGTYS